MAESFIKTDGVTGWEAAVSSTNPLPVSATIDTTGLATSAGQAAGNTSLASLDSHLVKADTDHVAGTVAVSNFPASFGAVQSGIWTVAVSGSVAVTGTFFQATQPVSLASVPTHAVTQSGAWSMSVSNASLAVTGTFWQATQPVSGTFFQATQPVSGTFWQATQPVSAAALPLPSGAATSAKQPALGVAGTASADVLSVQGVASMTALKTDGSAVTQPISAAALPLPAGAATAALQTTINTTLGTPFQAGGSIGNASFASTQSGVWSVRFVGNAGATLDATLAAGTAPTNGVAVLGQFTTTPPALTTGQTGALQSDANSNLRVVPVSGVATGGDALGNAQLVGTLSNAASTTALRAMPTAGFVFNGTSWDRVRSASASGTGLGVQLVEENGRSYSHISTSATTTVKSGAGTLHTITVNKPGATWTATVFDSTTGSGTTIGVINAAPASACTLVYDLAFATGLTIVTAGTTAGDITVVYR